MSEELRAKGYLSSSGEVKGDPVGTLEGFNLGNSTLTQLAKAKVIPDKPYAAASKRPDGLVVDREPAVPDVRLVVEHKDAGELSTETKRAKIYEKALADYCVPLDCDLAVITDGTDTYWMVADLPARTYKVIEREDAYLLSDPADLATDDGRAALAKTLVRIEVELNPDTGVLEPVAAVNPTRLAEQTWQTIWLASGENPDACLATFVEILLFKFLSDLGILTTDPAGNAVDFDSVAARPTNQILKHYFKFVRPEIKRLFPAGADGTSVINGIILNENNEDHGSLFSQIVQRFKAVGTFKRIDPEFKSRIFERFLKKSISQKNWGQYFTPRNVVKAMVEMSGIENLVPGAVVADPACGVGGFLLEPLVHKRPHDFRSKRTANLEYRGYDRDSKTIILAKANMLIHLSEVLENDPKDAPAFLAPILNKTFVSTATAITGSLSLAPTEEFDLVMTNPPYVVAGTGIQRTMIGKDPKLASYYDVRGSGVENLFTQLIVAGLKPGARALVIVPDGLLLRHSEEELKRHILSECRLEAIVSLPKNTFYSTPKKTYVLVIRKKLSPDDVQTHPVFTYLVKDVGETLDAKRFVIDDNDLPSMVSAFRLFQGAPDVFDDGGDARLKLVPIARFDPEEHWLVDRWWSAEERVSLGEAEETESIAPEDLATRLRELSANLEQLASVAEESQTATHNGDAVDVRLGDKKLFRLSIGKRVLKKDLHGKAPGKIPLYSANVNIPFGHIDKSNLTNFDLPSVLFGIDGDFELARKDAGVEFAITDHCGRIEILDPKLDVGYCRAAIALAKAQDFDRTLRPSLARVKELTFSVPVDANGHFDLEAQKAMASVYELITETLIEAQVGVTDLSRLQPDVMLPDSS